MEKTKECNLMINYGKELNVEPEGRMRRREELSDCEDVERMGRGPVWREGRRG